MPVYEQRHLLRVIKTPQEVAADFIAFCKVKQIITRGMCKVGYVQRRPPAPEPGHTGPSSFTAADLRLRALIANKDIAKDENIIMMPEKACLHPATAIQCTEFFSLFPRNMQEEYFLSSRFLQNSRIMERSLIRHNQFLLALYMTFLILTRTYRPDHLAQMKNGDFIKYIDFMPRSGDGFDQLGLHLSGWLDTPEVCRVGQEAVARHFNVTQAEVRPVILYALCMIFSRMVPVDHRQLLRFTFRDTPLAGVLDTLDGATPFATPQEGAVVQPPSPASLSRLVQEPIVFLCPLIDMCNHSASENVAVMVPDESSTYKPSDQHGPVICLRSLRDIAKGEELTMNYGAAPRELHMIWGMQNILQ